MSETTQGAEYKTIYDWLDIVRKRPGMYFQNLSGLHTLVNGYYSALSMHNIHENVPSMVNNHFGYWLRKKEGWSMALGWGRAIEINVEGEEQQTERFFAYVDKYRKLVSVRLSSVVLDERHNPTGKKVVIGFDGRIEKPDRIDVMQYQPEALHFLRFHYGERIIDRTLLSDTRDTTLEEAKLWVREEFQVQEDEWTNCETV
jgi:hypothetical protein